MHAAGDRIAVPAWNKRIARGISERTGHLDRRLVLTGRKYHPRVGVKEHNRVGVQQKVAYDARFGLRSLYAPPVSDNVAYAPYTRRLQSLSAQVSALVSMLRFRSTQFALWRRCSSIPSGLSSGTTYKLTSSGTVEAPERNCSINCSAS